MEVTRLSRSMGASAASLRVLHKSFSGAGSSLADASSMSIEEEDEEDEEDADDDDDDEDEDANQAPGTSTVTSLDADNTEIPAGARRPRNTRGSQKWSNVRAVMALYSSLRKIKR